MDLREFITETLIQITEGIVEAQQASKDKGVVIAPKYSTKGTDFYYVDDNYKTRQQVTEVKFKVGITVEKKSGEKAGIAVITGLFSGAGQMTSENVNQSVNTIEFPIPIIYPSGDNPEKIKPGFVIKNGKVYK